MNYKRIYEQLIDKASSQNRVKYQGTYYEKHHIIPKCLGGEDKKENFVLLTAREHYIAHLLLYKIYPQEYKLCFALYAMCNWGTNKNKDKKECVNSRLYEKIKIEASRKISEILKGRKLTPEQYEKLLKNAEKRKGYCHPNSIHKGEKNGLYGKKRPSYIGEAVAKANRERIWTSEMRAKTGLRGEKNPWYGKHITEEMKEKMRLSKCYRQLCKFPTNVIDVDHWVIYNTHGSVGLKGILREFRSFDNMIICVNNYFNTNYVPTHTTLKGWLLRKGLISYSQYKTFKKDFNNFKIYYNMLKQLYDDKNKKEDISSFLDNLINLDKMEN